MARRTYSEDKMSQAISMVRSGMSVKRVASALQLSRDTVTRWTTGGLPPYADADKVEGKSSAAQDRIGDMLEVMVPEMLESARQKVGSASFKDLLIGSGIGIEKLQLLRGQPTSRTEQQRVVYVVGNPLRDASLVAIGRTDPAQLPALEAEYVVTQDKEPSV